MMIFIADDDRIFSSFLVCNVNVRIYFHLLEKNQRLKQVIMSLMFYNMIHTQHTSRLLFSILLCINNQYTEKEETEPNWWVFNILKN